MNAREQVLFDVVKSVGIFGTNNASDFTSPHSADEAMTAVKQPGLTPSFLVKGCIWNWA
jgi:hypothetical protein